jgi:hypothetical protein
MILGAFRNQLGLNHGYTQNIFKCQVVRIFGLLKNRIGGERPNDPLVMWFGWEMSEILGAFRKPVGVKPWLGHPKYIKIKCQVVRIFGLLKNAQNRGWDGHNYYLSNDPLVMWFGWEMSEIQQKYNKNT